jgi:hypothetical protein
MMGSKMMGSAVQTSPPPAPVRGWKFEGRQWWCYSAMIGEMVLVAGAPAASSRCRTRPAADEWASEGGR